MGPLVPVLLLLALGLPLVLVAHRLRVSALVAYLITGAIAGPYGPIGLVGEHDLHAVAEIGAALLLFSLGLELDLHSMRRRVRQVAVGAAGQIGLTVAAGAGAALAFGLSLPDAIALGCCLAVSSTLIVLRSLDERRLRQREEGQTVVGLLLAQDLCLAPMLAVISLMRPQGVRPEPWAMLGGLVVCLLATFVLRSVLASAVFNRIRDAKLPELEVAFSITLALGAAFLTEHVGLGAAVGAFCAGLALGGDEHRTAIETSTRPLQGLMAILFFVSVGTQFDARFLVAHPVQVFGGLAVSIVVKALLAAAALRLAGLPTKAALGCGIMTGQIGEFSFVLASAAFSGGGSGDLHKLIIAIACLSLAATPLLIWLAVPLLPRSRLEDIVDTGNTIVVAGLGPVGNTVVETLHSAGHPLMLIDRNPRLLAPWSTTPGVRSHQGRIEDMETWLPLIGHRPALIVLTFPVADTSAVVATRLRALDPELVIIARSPYAAHVDELHAAGAQYVICDENATAAALLPLLTDALGAKLGARA